MFLALLTSAVLGLAPTSQDTVMAVRAGDRLVLDGFSGFVSVRSWDREDMEVRSDVEEDARIRVNRSGSRLNLQVEDRRSRGRELELELRIPAWMGVEINGRELEVDLRDLNGSVQVRNMDGDISLHNLGGPVEARSVQGGIQARGLRGAANLRTGHDDVEVDGATGELWIETISGDLELQNMTPRRLEVETTSGDVEFQGSLSRGGEYMFRSHDGDLTLVLSEPLDMDVSVLVYDGEFQSDFPIKAQGLRSGEELRFTLGSGGGRLVLETFDGDIEILSRR